MSVKIVKEFTGAGVTMWLIKDRNQYYVLTDQEVITVSDENGNRMYYEVLYAERQDRVADLLVYSHETAQGSWLSIDYIWKYLAPGLDVLSRRTAKKVYRAQVKRLKELS